MIRQSRSVDRPPRTTLIGADESCNNTVPARSLRLRNYPVTRMSGSQSPTMPNWTCCRPADTSTPFLKPNGKGAHAGAAALIRRSLPFDAWPEADRIAWTEAIAEGDMFNGRGHAAHWAATTRYNVFDA